MLDKPPLRDETIATNLRITYEVTAAGVAFLPLGYDADACVYRVEGDDGRAYFLKLKRKRVDDAEDLVDIAVAFPRLLRDRGIEEIVAPLPTVAGALRGELGGYALILHPFIEGEAGREAGLTIRQWTMFGSALRRIHASELPGRWHGGCRGRTSRDCCGGIGWSSGCWPGRCAARTGINAGCGSTSSCANGATRSGGRCSGRRSSGANFGAGRRGSCCATATSISRTS